MQVTYVLELLKPTKRKSDLIEQNIKQSQVNRVAISNKLKETNKLTSKDFDEALPSAVINQNIREVKALYKRFKKSNSKKKNLSFKRNQPICFNNQNYKIERHFVSFPLYKEKSKRYWFPVVKNNRLKELNSHINNGAKLGKASLFRKGSKYFFAVTVTIETGKANEDNVMGIDIGLNQLAVASIKNSDGIEINRQFHNGREAGYFRRKNKSIRRSLGKAKKPKKIEELKNKESRYITNLNHKISRKLVNLAVQEKVSTLVMEDLAGIRKVHSANRYDKNLNSWAFYELQQFIEYKAKKEGIEVVYVNPKYTSQTCSKCGVVAKSNRKRNLYSCKCGNRLHSDLNAARNIANKVFSDGKSLSA